MKLILDYPVLFSMNTDKTQMFTTFCQNSMLFYRTKSVVYSIFSLKDIDNDKVCNEVIICMYLCGSDTVCLSNEGRGQTIIREYILDNPP